MGTVELDPSTNSLLALVMCRLGLGLKAPALAWLEGAWASQNREPGQKPKIRLGLAWLWPGPGLLVDMHAQGCSGNRMPDLYPVS